MGKCGGKKGEMCWGDGKCKGRCGGRYRGVGKGSGRCGKVCWGLYRGSVAIGVRKCVEMWESVWKFIGAWGEVRRNVGM